MRDAAHHLVRPRHDPRERRARLLAIPNGKIRIQHQGGITGGELGNLAEETTAVRSSNGVEHLSQLLAPQVRLIRLVHHRIARLVLRTHHPSPREADKLILRIGLKFDPRHL